MRHLALLLAGTLASGCCLVAVPVACCGLAVDLWQIERDEKERKAAFEKRCDEPFADGSTRRTKGWCPK